MANCDQNHSNLATLSRKGRFCREEQNSGLWGFLFVCSFFTMWNLGRPMHFSIIRIYSFTQCSCITLGHKEAKTWEQRKARARKQLREWHQRIYTRSAREAVAKMTAYGTCPLQRVKEAERERLVLYRGEVSFHTFPSEVCSQPCSFNIKFH